MNIKEVQDRIIENMKKGGDLITDDGGSIDSWHEKSSQFLHINIWNGRQEQIYTSEYWVRHTIMEFFIKPKKTNPNDYLKMAKVLGIDKFIEK